MEQWYVHTIIDFGFRRICHYYVIVLVDCAFGLKGHVYSLLALYIM